MPGFCTLAFHIFLLVTQVLSKIKKIPEHAFTIFAKSREKILKFVVVGARQSFKFFRKLAWFL